MMVRGVIGIVRRKAPGTPLDTRIRELERLAAFDFFCVFNTPDALLFATANPAGPEPAAPPRPEPVVACGLIRNRTGLAVALGLNAAETSDEILLAEAYRRWGTGCCKKIYGDWHLASWDQDRRELFLARDHHGNTALFYHVTDDAVAFATSLPLLLALKLGPVALDPLYLAQVLVSWTAYHGEHTALPPIKRVPRAHYAVITPTGVRTHCYWRLEDVEPLRLAKREDYTEGFRDVFDTAVRESLPSEGTPASTLSCGLDSGAVTVTAAQILAREGRRLSAYVSTTVADYQPYISDTRIGDEQPLAKITAAAAGNVDLTPIYGSQTPIAALRRALEIVPLPQHAAANYYWIFDLFETAAAHGCPVLLTGQFGNSSISWPGDVFSQPLPYQIQKLGLRGWTRRQAKQILPPLMVRAISGLKKHKRWERTAIRTEFAEDQNLFERWLSDPMEAPYLPPLKLRSHILKPGRSIAGDLQAGLGAAAGIAVADPTADPRVLEYCFSVPDRIFIDPATGTDRWLIRAAMQGRLPDEVRLNQRRGRQAADLVPRLRACRDEVEDALEECASGPAADYVDVPYMRRVWHRIETEDNSDVFFLAITLLTRGIMAGLFVNGIGKRW
jgi:asparagine synthase (glutamine-hydrolysing)